jgi:hypothetical protein
LVDAPELFADDQEWIAKETRASGIAFLSNNAPEGTEHFDVDGAHISYRVQSN